VSSSQHPHLGAPAPLADLHLHLYGSVPAADVLDYLVTRGAVHWDWYEEEFRRAYGFDAPTRQVVERHRRGDATAAAEFQDLFVFGDEDAGNFDRFSGKGNIIWAGTVLGSEQSTRADIEAEVRRFAAAVRRDQLRAGVGYAEYRQRFDAAGAFRKDDRFVCDLLLALFDGTDTRLVERFAISLSRTDPWTAWQHVQDMALGPNGQALTGIDFCGVEEGYPPKDLRNFFATVHAFNDEHPTRALAILCHVGESFQDKSLESAIRWVQEAAEYGAHRLGHAIALGVEPNAYGPHIRQELVSERRDQIAYDLAHARGLRATGVPVDAATLRTELADLAYLPGDAPVEVSYDEERLAQVRRRQNYAMECVRTTGAVVEVCPTSNRRIGGIDYPARHPVSRFLKAGLPTVVCSDDPAVFGTTLRDELAWVGRTVDLSTRELGALAGRAWDFRSEVLSGRTSVGTSLPSRLPHQAPPDNPA